MTKKLVVNTLWGPLSEVGVVIGRQSHVTLAVMPRTMSKLHVQLFLREGVVIAQDNSSTNGTYAVMWRGEDPEEAEHTLDDVKLSDLPLDGSVSIDGSMPIDASMSMMGAPLLPEVLTPNCRVIRVEGEVGELLCLRRVLAPTPLTDLSTALLVLGSPSPHLDKQPFPTSVEVWFEPQGETDTEVQFELKVRPVQLKTFPAADES